MKSSVQGLGCMEMSVFSAVVDSQGSQNRNLWLSSTMELGYKFLDTLDTFGPSADDSKISQDGCHGDNSSLQENLCFQWWCCISNIDPFGGGSSFHA